MLSRRREYSYANDEWSRLLPDIRHNATVDLDAVFGEIPVDQIRASSFLWGYKQHLLALDIDMADELIRRGMEPERSSQERS